MRDVNRSKRAAGRVVWGVVLALGACAGRPVSLQQRQETNLREAVSLASQAEQAQKARRYEQAADLGRRAVAIQPSLGAAWNNLGISLMELGQNMEAVQAFQRAADALPTDPKPYENLGLLYLRVGWSEDALKYYVLSLGRDPYWLPSLRGSVVAAKNLLRSDEEGLERIKRGMLIETDPAWKPIFENERLRVSGELAEKNKALRSAN
jgi:tetratricopeptide (TPR) repeat protein